MCGPNSSYVLIFSFGFVAYSDFGQSATTIDDALFGRGGFEDLLARILYKNT